MMLIPKDPPIVSEKIRNSARAQDCTVRLPGVCNFNPETTVFAHLRMAGITGGGQKAHDLHGAYACNACHDHIDGKIKGKLPSEFIQIAFYQGIFRTQIILVRLGLIKIL
jgi:hypothetical protein